MASDTWFDSSAEYYWSAQFGAFPLGLSGFDTFPSAVCRFDRMD